jgi:hypothetical protein
VIGRSASWCSICFAAWLAKCSGPRNKARLDQRFEAKVDRTPSCWKWTGAKSDRGYGCIAVGGKTCYAHRIAYERAFGPLDERSNVTHLCESRSCVNPRHLKTVPRRRR